MEKAELKKSISKIKKFIKQRDFDLIDAGIELIRSLDIPTVFEELLKDCYISKDGKLIRNKLFSGSKPAQPFLDHALLNLIGYEFNENKLGLGYSGVKEINLNLYNAYIKKLNENIQNKSKKYISFWK